MVCLVTGMSIQELLGWPPGVTHRQMLMLIAWEEEQWNIPNRTDHYMMMLACINARANSKTPQSIQPKDFALKFERKTAKITKDEEAKQLAYAKAARMAQLGGMKALTVIDKEGNIIKQGELSPRGGNGLGPHPLLAKNAQDAERIRARNASNQAHNRREGASVGTSGSRTFTPKHRKSRPRPERENIIIPKHGGTDDPGCNYIVIRPKQSDGDGVQGG